VAKACSRRNASGLHAMGKEGTTRLGRGFVGMGRRGHIRGDTPAVRMPRGWQGHIRGDSASSPRAGGKGGDRLCPGAKPEERGSREKGGGGGVRSEPEADTSV